MWLAGGRGLGRREPAASGRRRPGRAVPTSEPSHAATGSSRLRRGDWRCQCREVPRRHTTIMTNPVTAVLSAALLNSRRDGNSSAAATPPSRAALDSAENRDAPAPPEGAARALQTPPVIEAARPFADRLDPDPLRRDRREVVSPRHVAHRAKYYRETATSCRRGNDSKIHPTFATASVMNESTAEDSSWGR